MVYARLDLLQGVLSRKEFFFVASMKIKLGPVAWFLNISHQLLRNESFKPLQQLIASMNHHKHVTAT
jgi:hypothetical protein